MLSRADVESILRLAMVGGPADGGVQAIALRPR